MLNNLIGVKLKKIKLLNFIKVENNNLFTYVHLWQPYGLLKTLNGNFYLTRFTPKFKRKLWTEQVEIENEFDFKDFN